MSCFLQLATSQSRRSLGFKQIPFSSERRHLLLYLSSCYFSSVYFQPCRKQEPSSFLPWTFARDCHWFLVWTTSNTSGMLSEQSFTRMGSVDTTYPTPTQNFLTASECLRIDSNSLAGQARSFKM